MTHSRLLNNFSLPCFDCKVSKNPIRKKRKKYFFLYFRETKTMEELGIEPPKLGGDQGVENQKPVVEENSNDPDLYTKYCKAGIQIYL